MVFCRWSTEPAARRIKVSHCMPYHELVIGGASSPRGIPGGPYVEPKF